MNAAEQNKIDSVKYWLEKGANVNFENKKGENILYLSILKKSVELCKLAITNGANVNEQTASVTPLMAAAFCGYLRICHLLIQGGAIISTKDNNGSNAASYAKNFGFLRVANYLQKPESYSDEITFDECFEVANMLLANKDFYGANNKANEALQRAKIELESGHYFCEKIEKLIVKINEELDNYILIKTHSIDISKPSPLSELKQKVSEMQKYGDYTATLEKMLEFALNDNEYLHAEVLVNALIENKKKKNELDKGYIKLLLQQGSIYLNIQEYNKSEEAFKYALLIDRRMNNHSYLEISILLSLSQLYQFTGDYEKSKKKIQEALDKIEYISTADKNYFQFCAFNLQGQLYSRIGNKELSLSLFKKSNSIASKYEDYKDPNYVMTVSNLGRQYIINGEIENATEIYKNLKVQLERNDIYNLTYCNCIENLGTCYLKDEKYSKAEYLFEYSARLKRNLGLDDETCHLPLAFLNLEFKNTQKADSLYKLTMMKFVGDVKNKFSYFSENERDLYLPTKNESLDVIKSYTYNYSSKNPKIGDFAFNNELFTKGLLLNTSLQIQNTVLQSGDPTLIGSWNYLRNLKRQISVLQSKPLSHVVDINKMEAQADSLDKVLTQKSQLYKQSQEDMQVKWQDVQSNLKPDEAAIEFICFNYYNKRYTDSIMYCALILKKNSPYPEMIPLFEEKQLDSISVSTKYRDDTEEIISEQYRGVVLESKTALEASLHFGSKLYNLVWKPLEASLKSIKTVYYAPSGKLHQVAFAAIPVDSTFLLSDKYNLHQVTSTRQIIKSNNVTSDIQNAVLFGGIQYELDNKQLAQVQTTTETGYLSAFVSDSTQRSNSFNYLKGTAEEVTGISEQFKNKKLPDQLYTGITASEAAFKKLNGTNTNIIHIATHGFFLPIEESKREDMRFINFDNERRNVIVKNPLLRSGLIMAGANRAWRGDSIPDNWEDGILTAHEISQINLTKTDLVVLSACETALGDIKGSEGVFGLQRAFKMAGVQTLIMSLWKVPDAQTSQLMQGFYKYWLSGMTKHDAFKKAQNEVRTANRNPYYWAAFVMVD